MCEKRIKKIKKGSHLVRLREARRIQRLRWLASPTPVREAPPPPAPAPVRVAAPVRAPAPFRIPIPQPILDKVTQNRVILTLAWKTIILMQKNKLIQKKIIALQRETSEFVASIMSNPENKRRYLEHVKLYGAGLLDLKAAAEARNIPLKIEPTP